MKQRSLFLTARRVYSIIYSSCHLKSLLVRRLKFEVSSCQAFRTPLFEKILFDRMILTIETEKFSFPFFPTASRVYSERVILTNILFLSLEFSFRQAFKTPRFDNFSEATEEDPPFVSRNAVCRSSMAASNVANPDSSVHVNPTISDLSLSTIEFRPSSSKSCEDRRDARSRSSAGIGNPFSGSDPIAAAGPSWLLTATQTRQRSKKGPILARSGALNRLPLPFSRFPN